MAPCGTDLYPSQKELESLLQSGIAKGDFYSYIISSLDRRLDESSPGVAYVSLNPKRAEWALVINPILLGKMLQDHPSIDREALLMAILIHEFCHIARNHYKRGFELKDLYSPFELNVAADLAVNCTIQSPHVQLLRQTGGLFPDDPAFRFPKDLSMEQYLTMLQKKREQENDTPDPLEQKIKDLADLCHTFQEVREYFDSLNDEEDHPFNSPSALEMAASSSLRVRIQKLMKSSRFHQHFGIGSGGWDWLMEWIFPKVQVSWKKLLKATLMGNIRTREWYRSFRRFHQRSDSGVILKGKFPKKTEQVLVLLDTSGSMGEYDYSQFMGVLQSLSNAQQSVSIVQWDYGMQSEPIPIEKYMRSEKPWFKGGGGTDMVQGVLEVHKKYPMYRRIIVVTDGGTPYFTRDNPSPVPVIWVLTQNFPFHNCDGVVIRLHPT